MDISAIHSKPKSEHLKLYNATSSNPDKKLRSYSWTFASRKPNLANRTRAEILAETKQEDAIVTAPIVYIDKTPHIIFALHNRPALSNKDSGGLHWEVVGGLTNDEDAQASLWQTAAKEIVEETGLNIVDGGLLSNSRFKRLANSAGLTDETTRCDVKICTLPKNGFDLDQISEDTIMRAVTVPLKEAMTFLHEQTQNDINVGLNTIAATANAQRVLQIPSDFEAENIEANTLWDLGEANKIKTQFQKEGYENPLYKKLYARTI